MSYRIKILNLHQIKAVCFTVLNFQLYCIFFLFDLLTICVDCF